MPLNRSNSNEDDCIADAMSNTVTPQDVALVVQRFTKDSSVQVLKYDLAPYSSAKLGFFGSHRQLTVEVKKNNDSGAETLKFFVKSVPYECEQHAVLSTEIGVFVEEHNFFDKVVPLILENYVGEKFAPICYLSKPDSLIMEDLRCQSYQLRASFFDCYPEVQSVLSTLARLHASSIIAEAKLTQSFEKPVTLKELFPDHFTEKFFQKNNRLHDWLKLSINIVYAVGKKFGHDPEKLRRGLEQLYEIVKPSKIHRNVVLHTDLWTNNIMFDDSKPMPKSVLVDFQILRYAPHVLDVLKLLHLHTSREFRKIHEEKLVQIYQSVMEETIKKSKLSGVAKSPTLQETIAAMDDLRLFGPGMATLYLPGMLIDPEILKERTKDSQSFNDFMFKDRIDFTLNLMKKYDVYNDRVEEAVDELAAICDTL